MEMFVIIYTTDYANFTSILPRIQNKFSNRNISYVLMSMMTSQVWEFEGSRKTQESKISEE